MVSRRRCPKGKPLRECSMNESRFKGCQAVAVRGVITERPPSISGFGRRNKKTGGTERYRPYIFQGRNLFDACFVRHGELPAAFGAARGKNLASVRGAHPLAETVFIDSLPFRRLVSPFHGSIFLYYYSLLAECKGKGFLRFSKVFRKKYYFLPSGHVIF